MRDVALFPTGDSLYITQKDLRTSRLPEAQIGVPVVRFSLPRRRNPKVLWTVQEMQEGRGHRVLQLRPSLVARECIYEQCTQSGPEQRAVRMPTVV